jgi:hypothetical protein
MSLFLEEDAFLGNGTNAGKRLHAQTGGAQLASPVLECLLDDDADAGQRGPL